MPSANTWTIGWAAYFGWIMQQMWDTRTAEVGWNPIHNLEAFKLKEKYLRSKAMIEKYNEELEAVDEDNVTAEDAAKFGLATSSNGQSFWGQFKNHPHWRAVEAEISAEVREQMYAEHPDYKILQAAEKEGGYKKLFMLDGPWLKAGYDNGLHGHFDGWVARDRAHGH